MLLKVDVVFKNGDPLLKVSVPENGGGFIDLRSFLRILLRLFGLSEFLFALGAAALGGELLVRGWAVVLITDRRGSESSASAALRDANVYALHKRLEYFGDDGGYLDGTRSYHWLCKNSKHGCGYVDEDGKLQGTRPIFGIR